MPCCPPTSSTPASTNRAAAEVLAAPKVHLHLQVGDLARSVDFYRALFGVEPVKLLPGYAKFLPGWGPVNLALSQGEVVRAGGALSHLGIQVTTPDEVQRQLHRVQAAGLATRVEMGVDCCHANQDKFWVRDPDGVSWEIYVLNHDIGEDRGSCATRVATSACCPA